MKAKGVFGAQDVPAMLCIIAPLQRLLLQERSAARIEDARFAQSLLTAGEPEARGEFHPGVLTNEVRHIETWFHGGLNE